MSSEQDTQRVREVVNWLIFKEVVRNRRELAEKLGYTESSFSQIMNGKVALSKRFLNKLSMCDDRINPNFLLTGEGEMLHENTNKASYPQNPDGCTDLTMHDVAGYYGNQYPANQVMMSREVFQQISQLLEANNLQRSDISKLVDTIASQQRTIERMAASVVPDVDKKDDIE